MKDKDFFLLEQAYKNVLIKEEELSTEKNKELLYQAIVDTEGTEPFPVDKAFVLKILEPKNAQAFLSSMTPEQRETVVNVYGVGATKKFLNKDRYNKIFGNNDVVAVSSSQGIFYSELANRVSKEDVLNNLLHELQHATDRVSYPHNKPDWDNNPPTSDIANSPSRQSVAKSFDNSNYNAEHNPYKDYMSTFISPGEIRGRIAESRKYLGVISTPQEFEQKWTEAQKKFSQRKSDKEWLDTGVTESTGIPDGFRQLIYIYNVYIKDPKEKQKLYNYILRTALDNSVAVTTDKATKKLA